MALVGWWKFDENTGTTTADSQGSATGTLNGGCTWESAGKIGACIHFDATTGTYVSMGDVAALNPGTSDFSITAWVKHDGADGPAARKGIVSKETTSGTDRYYIGLNQTTFTLCAFWRVDGTTSFEANFGGTGLTAGTWYHVAVTFDRSANAIGYVNGTAEPTVRSISGTDGLTFSNTESFWIGSRTGGRFDGYIDDVRFYNHALSAAEVAAIYAAGTAVTLTPTTGSASASGATPARVAGKGPGAGISSATGAASALAVGKGAVAGSASATGASPTLSLTTVLTPTAGSASTTGASPTLSLLTTLTLTPTTGAASATGASPSLTQDLRLLPIALASSINLTGAYTTLTDNPDTPDANWLTAIDPIAVTDVRITFEDPSLLPVGEQSFLLWLRKTAGAPHPTVTISLYQSGAFIADLLTGVAVTSEVGQRIAATWDASALTTPDGSNVSCRIVSVPGEAA